MEKFCDPARSMTGMIFVEINRSSGNGDPGNGGLCRKTTSRDGRSKMLLWNDAPVKRRARDFAKEYHKINLYVDRGAVLSEVQLAGGSVAALLEKYWDLRMFGGVLTRYGAQGRMTGPVQFDLTESVLPVEFLTIDLTRVAGEAKADLVDVSSSEPDPNDLEDQRPLRSNMGSKEVVEHALMPFIFTYSAKEGKRTGVTENDLRILFDSLIGLWCNDRTGTRTGIHFRRLYLWEHPNDRCAEHTHITIDRVKIALKPDVVRPRSFDDYTIKVDKTGLSEKGIEFLEITDKASGFPV